VSRRAVARCDDLLPGEMAGVTVGRTPVLLVNVGGAVYAYHDSCPHRGVPLSRGRLAGRAVVCGMHDRSFDACTGRGLDGDGPLCALPVSVDGGDIVVELPDGDASAGEVVAQVGPELRAGPAGAAVISAIRDLNLDVRVIERGEVVRVRVPRACRLTRAAVEAKLGGPFRFPGDLETLMTSFEGRFSVTCDDALWEA